MALTPGQHIMGIPKYIYTPDKQRAFLSINSDLFGNWSAGFQVWLEQKPDEIFQQSFNYGPYVNDCPDIDTAIIQLFNAYTLWEEERQDGLLRG